MTKFLPIFPLSIVVCPGEQLSLHIFEARYKQLIKECFQQKKLFAIPTVIENELCDYGCTVQIEEIVNETETGEMDIKTRGVDVVRILEVINEIPEKLYSGAIVSYPENQLQATKNQMPAILTSVRELHKLLEITKNYSVPDTEITSYDVAHHVGFSLQEEYEVLILMDELQRQEYLRRHLVKAISMLQGMDLLKEKIKLNGHFKNLSGFNWK